MSNNKENDGYGITVFKPGTPPSVKTRGIIFFIIFCLIILIQAFYWLFANSAKPLVLGMPFGMFFIVLFIAIEFIALLIVYFAEAKDVTEGGGS
jgi:phosphoglycerol transferase MdoB-like AlkP superfamily enzyme